MSEDTVIAVENVSKAYRIWHTPASRLTSPLMAGMGRGLFGDTAPGRALQRRAAASYRDFWALKDISFEVHRGEAVGIIGRNGSGKSTLLQIIAGTLQPTAGSVRVSGRVAALLELGSGFNPDFTGRENVFLNGAVLGLTHREVEERFDSIATFADIGEFLDEPAKTYSSGMLMRLGFAVAVCVDADVLIVDEALSVGDAPFQAKCFARIHELMSAGASILFVSHDTGSVMSICSRAIYLRHGVNQGFGPAAEVCELYREECLQATGNLGRSRHSIVNPGTSEKVPEMPETDFHLHANRQRKGSRELELINVWLETLDGRKADAFSFHEHLVVCKALRATGPIDCDLSIGISVQTLQGHELLSGTDLAQDLHLRLEPGEIAIARTRTRLSLKAGDYYMRVTIWGFVRGPKYVDGVIQFPNADLHDWVEFASFFRILDNPRHSIYGPVHVDCTTKITGSS